MAIQHEFEAKPPRARRSDAGSYTRLLFVDDDPAIRAAASRCLSGRGFLVDVAENATEAKALAATTDYPVVATDLAMPGGDGVSLIRDLHLQSPATVFVIVTGKEAPEVPVEAALQSSVASIVRKPWDPDELVTTLRRAARLWESRSSRPPPPLYEAEAPHEILLIEDDDTDADLFGELLDLTDESVAVTRVSRLAGALEQLETHQYDVVVSDLVLPDARGLDSVLRIRNAAEDAPLVVLSGVNDETLAVQAVQAGAQDVLFKGGIDAPALGRSLRYARERKRSEQNLAQLALTDPLTGLANRARFLERLDHTLSRSRRTEQPFAVLFIDLDHFKPINDQLGHDAGDEMLREIARRLSEVIRDSDIGARLGGDEFAIILDSIVESGEAARIAERILRVVSRPHTVNRSAVQVTASIGVACFPDTGNSGPELLKAADASMYRAKRKGRNRYAVSADSPHSEGPLTAVASTLREALDHREFSLLYQPQYDLRSGTIVGAEAFLRWNRAGLRAGVASEFLPLLEKSGEIIATGAWAIRSACAELRFEASLGLPFRRVAINVSERQLLNDGFLELIQETLARVYLSGEELEIEVTEETIASSRDVAVDVLSRLRERGVRVALDNFGQGPTSLAELCRLPLDAVKIDRSLVANIAADTQTRTLVRGIVTLASELRLDVVAAGVENAREKAALEEAGCHLFQGYYFGRPAPLSDFVQSLTSDRLLGETLAEEFRDGSLDLDHTYSTR